MPPRRIVSPAAAHDEIERIYGNPPKIKPSEGEICASGCHCVCCCNNCPDVNADAGIHTSMTDKLFFEFKFEYRYDSEPAPGKVPSDLRYIASVGWNF